MQTLGSLTRSRSSTKPIAYSVLAHVLVVAALLYHRHPGIAPIKLPGTDHGHNLLVTYLPGIESAQSTTTAAKPPTKSTAPTPTPTATPQPKTEVATTPNPASTTTAQTNSAAGNDALGSGDINIALVSYFPTPKPTLSALPHGTRGDVVLDIVIDETGKVSDLKMTSGLGYGVDETVIATVQQWLFHPATKNGHPVASEQELHFHYERG